MVDSLPDWGYFGQHHQDEGSRAWLTSISSTDHLTEGYRMEPRAG